MKSARITYQQFGPPMVFYRDEQPVVAHWDHGPGEFGIPELNQIYETHFRVTCLRFEYAVSEAELEWLKPRFTDNIRRQIDFMQETGNVASFINLVKILAKQRDDAESRSSILYRDLMRVGEQMRKAQQESAIRDRRRSESLRRILALKTSPKPNLP